MSNVFEIAGDVSVFGLRAVTGLFRRPFEGEQIRLTRGGRVEIASTRDCFRLRSGRGFDAAHAKCAGHVRRDGVDSYGSGTSIFSGNRSAGYRVTGGGESRFRDRAVLSNMRATGQIDAIESLSIDSFKFLVAPRIVACTLALPLLTLFLDFSGLLGGFLSKYASSRLSF
jgi:phospholipid/cholesterol/gamma-HCH transport system permease protein